VWTAVAGVVSEMVLAELVSTRTLVKEVVEDGYKRERGGERE
jgi:hypothetical protein